MWSRPGLIRPGMVNGCINMLEALHDYFSTTGDAGVRHDVGRHVPGLTAGTIARTGAGGGRRRKPVPDTLVDATLRNIAPLPLLPDGSAPEHPASAAGTITEPYMWRYTKGQAPAMEYDYRKLKIKVDARGMAKRTGTLTFADLEQAAAPFVRDAAAVRRAESNRHRQMDRRAVFRCGQPARHPAVRALLPAGRVRQVLTSTKS